jgi:hypothetical protein
MLTDGVAGCVFTTTSTLASDVHPAALVSVNVYVLALAVTSPVTDILTTDGLKLYVLVLSYPMIWKLPVPVVYVGCVFVPAPGAEGVVGCVFTTTSTLASDVHPAALVSVNVYVLALAATSPVTDILTTDGLKLYVLVLSYPMIWKLLVPVVHVGRVTAPSPGAKGVEGCAFTVKLVPVETQPVVVFVVVTS